MYIYIYIYTHIHTHMHTHRRLCADRRGKAMTLSPIRGIEQTHNDNNNNNDNNTQK